jgi:hypothetical protein
MSGFRIFGVLLLIVGCVAAGKPPNSVDRSMDTPDFCQTDPTGQFAGNGDRLCGAVAVSNSLIYLAHNGFPKMLPPTISDKDAQIKIIHQLASSEFMNTNEKHGTGSTRLMAGVQNYVRQSGYQIVRLEQQGWMEATKEFPRQSEVPSLDWIKEGLSHSSGAVWLWVGWYKVDSATSSYVRSDGHWVTLVGYGKDQNRGDNSSSLLIHDPSPRTGMTAHTQRVKLVPINSGTLERKSPQNQTRRRDAKGFFELKGEMVLKRGADAAILDTAVVLALK